LCHRASRGEGWETCGSAPGAGEAKGAAGLEMRQEDFRMASMDVSWQPFLKICA